MKKLLVLLTILINSLLHSQIKSITKNIEFFGGEVWACKLKVSGSGDYMEYLNKSFYDAYLGLKNSASFRINVKRNINISFYKDTNIVIIDTIITNKRYYRENSLINNHLYLDSGVMVYKPLIYDYNKASLCNYKLISKFYVIDKMCNVDFYYYGENGYNNEGILHYNENYNLTNNQPNKKYKDSIINLNMLNEFILDSIKYRKEFILDSIKYRKEFEHKLFLNKQEEEKRIEEEEKRKQLEIEYKQSKKASRRTVLFFIGLFISTVTMLLSLE